MAIKWRPHGDSNPGYRRERARLAVDLINIFKALLPKCGRFIPYILLSAFITQVHASDWYVPISFGKSHLSNPAGQWHNFGHAVNAGYDWTATERANTWALGVGNRTGWGTIEALYHDFGDTKSFAGYPYDPGYTGPAAPNGCDYPEWPCNLNTQWVYHYGTGKGISISALPELKIGNNSAAFVRFGATFYRTTFSYKIAGESGNANARTFDSATACHNTGVSPIVGVGLRFGNFTVEGTAYPSLEALCQGSSGSFQEVKTFTVGYRVEF